MVKDVFQIQLKCIQNNLKQMYIIMGQIQVTWKEGSCQIKLCCYVIEDQSPKWYHLFLAFHRCMLFAHNYSLFFIANLRNFDLVKANQSHIQANSGMGATKGTVTQFLLGTH